MGGDACLRDCLVDAMLLNASLDAVDARAVAVDLLTHQLGLGIQTFELLFLFVNAAALLLFSCHGNKKRAEQSVLERCHGMGTCCWEHALYSALNCSKAALRSWSLRCGAVEARMSLEPGRAGAPRVPPWRPSATCTVPREDESEMPPEEAPDARSARSFFNLATRMLISLSRCRISALRVWSSCDAES